MNGDIFGMVKTAINTLVNIHQKLFNAFLEIMDSIKYIFDDALKI